MNLSNALLLLFAIDTYAVNADTNDRDGSLRKLKSSKSFKSSKKNQNSPNDTMCGPGTEYDAFSEQCVIEGLSLGMDTSLFQDCNDDDASCYCESSGYGSRGPKLVPHKSCNKYVACDGRGENETATVMQCEPGFAYDVVAQICYFKGDVDCLGREEKDMGEALPSKCLSELNPNDPICGCETYLWNSVTLVPDSCYGSADVDFQCSKDAVITNDLEIGIGDGIRP